VPEPFPLSPDFEQAISSRPREDVTVRPSGLRRDPHRDRQDVINVPSDMDRTFLGSAGPREMRAISGSRAL